MFLTPEDIGVLTGIRIGRRIKGVLHRREELQVAWLRTAGIPFYVNARGAPIIARATIEGKTEAPKAQVKPKWESNAWEKLKAEE